jgi:geranylgeranyl diphosphate synthase type I
MTDKMARLERLRAEINQQLGEYFAALPNGLNIAMSADGRQALERLQEFTMRPAKRIRGALAMLGYEMFGGTRHAAALDLAVVVELMQSYLLIVDDVMDRSVERRGGTTLQLQYYAALQEQFGDKSPAHQGDMMALNIGLLAQHLAAGLLNEIDELPARVLRAGQVAQANLIATGLGQMDDLLNQAGKPTNLEAIRQMYKLKSSYYTFVNPLQTGAALAGASESQLRPLKEFGLHAGVAFQLQDDIMGMFGDEQQTGKSPLDDLREGKLTMLMQHALEHAAPAELQIIHASLGNEQVTAAQHAGIRQLLTQLGSRNYVHQQAQQEVVLALQVLHAQPGWEPGAVAFLTELLNYIINRDN